MIPIKKTRLVMCEPRYLSVKIPNNVFMKGEQPNVPRAITEWKRTVKILSALDQTILQIPPVKGCQDQVYVANIAVALNPHIVLANYKAPGRACEVPPAKAFFQSMGYNCVQPPFKFEGYADLRKWKDGYYFGGWGLFTDRRALEWIANTANIRIIPIHEINPKSYHLDCCLSVLNEETFMVTKSGIDEQSLASLKKRGNVIFTPDDIPTTGITNGILLPDKKIYLSGTFNPEQKDYRKAMEWLLTTMDKFGYSVIFCDVDEYNKSGADLSCTVMTLDF